jgi:hypothetical protein
MVELRSESRKALGEGHGWRRAGQGTHGKRGTRSFFPSVLHGRVPSETLDRVRCFLAKLLKTREQLPRSDAHSREFQNLTINFFNRGG